MHSYLEPAGESGGLTLREEFERRAPAPVPAERTADDNGD
jgi:hypothetical protein